jgi:hypothetical protein
MGTWKIFWNLNSRDRRAVLTAASVIVASRVGLRTMGYRGWSSLLLSRLSAGHARPSVDNAASLPERLVRLTAAAARNLPFKPTCLERSIGLWWLLRRRGFGAEIRIGGRKTGEQFEAHAWVEYAGIALNDSGDEHRSFSVFGDSEPVAARELR